ncbi:mucin-2-like [Metopolophium dirhodum]|uniref:mucin-2-like n=1 Tax=Metopolophium dirhodum TaxID=44670 RepID=UPI00298F6BC1|nr:mucin-2-like [Metopolophium dirhodum]
MADLNIFVIVVMVLVAKDSAFSCSLRSHKHGLSHPCLPSTSDSTSNSHLTPVSNTISSSSDSSFSPSSSSSGVHANGTAISSTPAIAPDTSSLGSIPFIPTTPAAPTDNTAILNSLIQLLLSPAFSTLHSGKTQTSDKSNLPSPSTPNASQSPASVSKPHTTSLPCAPVSASSSSSSILPASPPCGSASSILNTVQIPKLPYSESTPSSSTNPDSTNILTKVSSLVPSLPYLSTSKPTPLSLPCPLFTPTLNKNIVPGKKPCAILSHPVGPSLSVLPGVLRGSSSTSNRPVPVPVSEESPAPVLEHEPEIVPEEFPAPSNVPVSIPAVTSTSTPTSIPSFNPAFINLLHKLLVASQAKNESSLIPSKTHAIPTLNATSISDPDIKPHIISPACGTSSELSSSCLSSTLHNQSNGSIYRLQHILRSMPSPPVSGISFGYNPEFMKLLIKNLLSNQTSSLPPLSSLYSLLQTKLNTTVIVPLIPNPVTTSTTSRPLSELIPNVFNTSSNNTLIDTAPDTNQNTSISNDQYQYLTNILINHLTSSNASKTSLPPCLPSTNSHSISTLNSTPVSYVPCIPPFSSLPDILSKLSSLTPGSNPSFPGLIPSPIITSLPNVKPFSKQVQNLTPVPILTPTSYPLSPTSDINLCRSKHKGPLQLSSSTSTAVDPCFQNVIRPHTPHLPLPCSLSHNKLSSGCKNILPAV